MPVSTSNEPCKICGAVEVIMHSHHTVPQSRGGKNSLQIQLCPTCHNALHAHALALVARTRNRKIKLLTKNFWRNSIEETNARPFLEVLVSALLMPIPADVIREHLLSTTVSTELFEEMKLLQLDLGLSSMEKTIRYCFEQVLTQRGLKNEEGTKRKNNMWFLQLPDA